MPTEAALREVWEETGIALPRQTLQFRTTRYVRIPNWDYELHIFHAYISAVSEIFLQSSEHDGRDLSRGNPDYATRRNIGIPCGLWGGCTCEI